MTTTMINYVTCVAGAAYELEVVDIVRSLHWTVVAEFHGTSGT